MNDTNINSILNNTSLTEEKNIEYTIGRYEIVKDSDRDKFKIIVGFNICCPDAGVKEYTETFIWVDEELSNKTDMEICQIAYERHYDTVDKIKKKLSSSSLVGWEFIPNNAFLSTGSSNVNNMKI